MSVIGVSLTSEAAPIEATATAEAGKDGEADRARDKAISAARRVALEQAIAGVDTPVDPEAVKQVLARAEAWTAGYRVLEVVTSETGVEVRIEAEIDLPRLRKRIAQPSADAKPKGSGFAWGTLNSSGCAAAIDEAAIRDPLEAYGIVTRTATSKLTLTVSCSDRGAVTHTHVRAAAVEIIARSEGDAEFELTFAAQGFAENLDAANRIALDRAVAELADELTVEARGDLELRVEQPWPAARVTALGDSLADGVMGVDAVELAGIAADGAVILRVGGNLDVQALGRSLQTASFPGFSLIGLRIDGARALRVRMQ
jgi:hypothetical protein